MIRKIILTVLCGLPFVLMAQKGFTIKGQIGVVDTPAVAYLEYREGDESRQDSVILEKGKFQFQGMLSYPVMASLSLAYDGKGEEQAAKRDYLQFYIENSEIKITAKDSLRHATIHGSEAHEDSQRLRAMQHPYKKTADSLVAIYHSLTPEERKDTAFTNMASVIMRETQHGYDSVNRVFIAENPDSHITLVTFREVELAHNFNPDTAQARFARLSEASRSSVMGRRLQAIIDIGKRTNVGVIAMDFEQQDTTGRTVRLSDFRGEYVLLDFWASWCVPCRAENPVMLAAYNKYKDSGFTILGVSLDDEGSRQAWLKAIEVDGIPWTQVSELKGFESEAAVQYGITAIPTNFLIDPAGRIVARNLRGENLDKALSEIFKK